MAAPVLQFKRGNLASLPGLQAGEPGFTVDKNDLYVGIDSTTGNNQFIGSGRFWDKGDATNASGVKLVEAQNNGASAITLKAPASLSDNQTYVMPAEAVNNGFLKCNSSGEFSWDTAPQNSGAVSDIAVTDESSDTTCFPMFSTSATGDIQPKTGSNLTFNSSSGQLTASTFSGNLTGAVTGNVTGNVTGDLTGNSSGTHTGAVTGNVTGDLTGDVTGDVTGDLTGNVIGNISSASSGVVVSPANGKLVVEGDTGSSKVGRIQLQCHVNSHGQTVSSQPHSESATNDLKLPGGSTIGNSDATLVSDTGTQTLTNKTLTAPTITGAGAIAGVFTGNITGNQSGGTVSATSAAVADLTSGRVVLAGTSGELEDSGNLTFDGSTMTVTGAASVTTNLTVGGNLTVNGTTTQVNTTNTTIEDVLLELQVVDGGALSSDTDKDVGLVLNYYSGSAKKAAIYWDDSAGRIVLGGEVSESAGVLTASAYSGLEIGSLYVNDCAGQTQVISCSGTTRSLENITIDGGSF